MKTGLESHDLFLYFGHGSGSQYIKGRTIRKLDRCAVTFLMGCSSGSLSEAGEFEPYGTPINYIHAGWYVQLIPITESDDLTYGSLQQSSARCNPLGRYRQRYRSIFQDCLSQLGSTPTGSFSLKWFRPTSQSQSQRQAYQKTRSFPHHIEFVFYVSHKGGRPSTTSLCFEVLEWRRSYCLWHSRVRSMNKLHIIPFDRPSIWQHSVEVWIVSLG